MIGGRRPNILFIMADQLSALATSPYGNRDVKTPHLQALAERGVVFEHSYCNAPLCTPSRMSMMAGQLAGSIPVNDNSEELPASVPTFVHFLRHAGYTTILSGKMHYVGPDQLHGFEARSMTDIYPSDFQWVKSWAAQGDPPRRVGLPGDKETGTSYARQMAQMVKESGPLPWTYQLEYDEETHFHALAALRGLVRRRGPDMDQPWFLCVSYTHPHDPYVNTQEYWDRYEGADIQMPEPPPPGWEPPVTDVWTNSFHGVDVVNPTPEDVYRSRRGYYASTSYVDDKVGELLDEIDRLGLTKETIVVLTADHGDMVGERGMWFKRTVREWSARVPLLFAGPGISKGERVTQNCSLVDLYPTMLDLAGIEMPADFPHRLDGNSLAPFLRGDAPADWPDEAIVENNGEATIKPIRALLKGHYKYIYTHERPDELYDLREDPHEWRNLIDDPAYAEVAQELRTRMLDSWDPAETERQVLASQRLRAFLKETQFQGKYTPWDFQPFVDASKQYVRRGSNQQWDPDLGR
ncbi:MAG TPA: choline-sulfatase [Chloroflexota bacterium]|nr:choline-sulfatase [Chloroflexota bacterium]